MNLQHYALVIAAFLLSGKAGAMKTPKRYPHQGLPPRDHFHHLGDTPTPITNDTPSSPNSRASLDVKGGCFPALGYTPPPVENVWETPNVPLDQWRCDIETERGFLGFSYDVGSCQSYDDLFSDFSRMRDQFNARYVRLYSWCDWRNNEFPADVVRAAYNAGIGVYFTIWFGFDGTNDWMWRRDTLITLLQNVPLSRYVMRSIDVGSEPLFDSVLSPDELAQQVWYMKNIVNQYGIQVSISDMQYGFTSQGGAQVVLDAVDVVHANVLPFFDQDATYGSNAWPSVEGSANWFRDHTSWSKKIVFTQTGWPTNTNVWPPNNPAAQASYDSSKAYLDLLDAHCEDFKNLHGGVGWFWQIWSDAMLDGWGALDWNSNPKFQFSPRTDC